MDKTKIIPIVEMPNDIEKILTDNDYIYSLTHPDGFR